MYRVKHIIRWSEWGDSKLPFIVIAWLLISLKTLDVPANFEILVQAFGFGFFYLAFGYMFNDWMDRDLDIKAGKRKIIHQFQAWQIWCMLIILILMGLGFMLPQLNNPHILLNIIICYFFAITYSGTRFRFKERGAIGLLVASLSQRTLLASLVFLAMEEFGVLAIVYLSLTLVIGLRWMLTHQIDDHGKDQLSQVNTFAVNRGIAFSKKQLVWLLNLEIVLIIYIAFYLSSLYIWIIHIAYVVLTILMSKASSETPWQMLQTPSSAYLVLADFYFLYWPLGLSSIYSFYQPAAWIVFVFLSILLCRYIRQHFDDLVWLSTRLRKV